MLDLFFSLASASVLPAWIALAVAPAHRWTQRLSAGIIPAMLAAAYVVLLVGSLSQPGMQGGFGSLDDVAALFANRQALLAGWIHYLAFDLFVGAWEAREADRLGMARWLLVLCLVLTFMAGPAGWLLFMAVRARAVRRIEK